MRLDSKASSAIIVREKQRIRKRILKKLKSQKEEQRRKKSLAIKRKLFASSEFKRAKTVMFYVSDSYEVQTRSMIKQALKMGKKIAVPMTDTRLKKLTPCRIRDLDKQLCKGPYGIYQPRAGCKNKIPASKIDLVLVPGVAFDKNGRRLGRGAGYYDRLLKKVPRKTPRLGLAFDFQVLKSVPTLSHDARLTGLIAN